MGRLIDADKLFPDVMKADGSMAISQGQLAYAHTVEAIPKADYENRLKADVVAMLTEIQLEMESLRFGQPPRKYVVDECLDIIQQKIAERGIKV